MHLGLRELWSLLQVGGLLAVLSETCWAQAPGEAAPAPPLALTNRRPSWIRGIRSGISAILPAGSHFRRF